MSLEIVEKLRGEFSLCSLRELLLTEEIAEKIRGGRGGVNSASAQG